MKISLNKKIVHGPWGGGNQMLFLLSSYLQNHGYEISFSLDEDTKIVIIMDIKDASCTFPLKKLQEFKQKKDIKVIHRINDNGSHRQNNTERSDQAMISVNKSIADYSIFISHWLRKYYEERGLILDKKCVIPNGTNRSLFCPDLNLCARNPDTPLSIITHHWSSNMAKGFAIYDQLDKFCKDNPRIAKFKYMGNYPSNFLTFCEKISPRPYSEIPFYLRPNDIYVTATQFESGGCHIIEGMSCGLIPFVRLGGGGTEEYACGFGQLYGDGESLIEAIKNLYNDYNLYLKMRQNIRDNYSYSSDDMSKQYLSVIEGLYS